MKSSLKISVVFFLILLFVTAILVLFPDAALQLVGDDSDKRMLEAFAHIHHEQTETTTFDLGAIVDMCESRLLEHDLYVCNHGQASCKTTDDGRGHCNNKSFKPRRSLI